MIWQSFRNKLLLLFVLVAFVPVVFLGYWSVLESRNALQQQVEYDLNALVDTRALELEDYYHAQKDQLSYLATTEEVAGLIDYLSSAAGTAGLNSPLYRAYLSVNLPRLKVLKKSGGFADLYLLSPVGDVLFSAEGKSENGTNLIRGPFMGGQLARVFIRANTLMETSISRRVKTGSTSNILVTYIATPVFEDGSLIGVLAAQLDSTHLYKQFANYTGLGKTGEVIFAERANGNAVIINRLRHNTELSSQQFVKIGADKGLPIQKAVVGDRSSGVAIDYRDEQVIAAWRYLPELDMGIVLKIDTREAFALAEIQQNKIVIFVVFSLVASLLAAFYFSRWLSRPLVVLTDATNAFAKGDMRGHIPIGSRDEMGRLAEAHNQMLDNAKQIVEQIDGISHGDFNAEITLRSERDVLGIALQRLASSLHGTAEIASLVAKGNYDTEMEIKGPKDELGGALNKMILRLKERDWQQQGRQLVADVLREQRPLEELCNLVIATLCKFFNASVGTVYTAEEGGTLQFRSGFSHSPSASHTLTINPGQGLLGQVAIQKTPIVIDRVPEDYLSIESSLGETAPRHLLVYPVVHADAIQVVMEFASLEPFAASTINMLDMLAPSIGINIVAARARDQQQLLLEETLKQSLALKKSERELSEQQQELQASNEELTQQTEELNKSQDNLQQQREELRVINEELEEQKEAIAKQNVALEKARNEAEQKALEVEQASQYKSEFLANMSHELRTPLNSLLILAKSFAENEDENLNADQIEAGEIIHDSATDLLDMINGILDLSKIEAGKMIVHAAEMQVALFSQQIRRQFKHVAANKQLEFDVEVANDIPTSIYTDEGKLGQIIKNLLSNAFKFTSEGGITVRLQVPEESVADAAALAIEVTDSGIGIPEKKQALIFEAFQQADGSTSRSYGGTGLGLSICRELSRMLGGKIEVRSVPGSGSTFTLFLPERLPESDNVIDVKNDARAKASEEPDQVEKVRQTEKPKLTVIPSASTQPETTVDDDREQIEANDETMLVIEDDPAFAGVVVDLARRKGFKCLMAASGGDGVRLAQRYKPTGILLDLGLPDMDGAEVIEHLKTGTDTRHIPVHVLSGRDDAEEIANSNAVGVLTKPVTPEDLGNALSKISDFANNKVRELLIVEDDPSTQAVIQRLIGGDNINTTVAKSGTESLKLLRKVRYDCVVLDLGLPDMDGFELLDKIASNNEISKPPLIVYSARDLSESDYEHLRSYTNSIVVKGVCSETRLRDEAALFLHSVQHKLAEEKPRVITAQDDSDCEDLRGKTILIVDDDMRNIYALSRSLKKRELKVLVAKDGEKALQQLEEHGGEIDCVLMDIMMPVMDGYETTQKIRQQDHFQDLPVIALTAHAMADDRERCLQAGASDYMTKPVEIERLLAQLKVWLCK